MRRVKVGGAGGRKEAIEEERNLGGGGVKSQRR